VRAVSAAPALELDDLHKAFGATRAVDGVSLAVPRGAFLGLLGPNGAGKTTALSLAVGLLRPDAGTARVLGVDVWAEPDAAKLRLGVLPDDASLPGRLTGAELLRYLGLLRGLDGALVQSRADELLTVLDLRGAADALVADYSTGMRKKIALATAVLHAPALLVLDEPFEAVDPISAATIRSLLCGFVAGGGTIVLSSHVLALVERLCDHVAVMARGKIVAAGPLDAVRGDRPLEDAFAQLVGAERVEGALSWL